MLSLNDFINTYTGKPNVGNTPENIGQCVGLVEVWDDNLGEPHIWGNAKDLCANAQGDGDFVVIYNTPAGVPGVGDIFCFDGTYGGGAGHTGIVTAATTSSVTLFEQNDPEGSTPHIKTYTYNHSIGWIHPKILDNQESQMIIQDQPNWFGRCQKTMVMCRGRDLGQEEFKKYAVGAEFLHWVEAVEDNPEADAAQHAQEVGQVAVRDNWQQQIYDLQAEVKALGSPTVLSSGVYKVN